MAMGTRPKTRSVTDHWMVGQESSVLKSGEMPTRRSVLKEVLFKRNLPENKRVNFMSLVSCGFQGFDSKCSLDGGCSNKSPDERCSLSKIKWRYQEAGIPTTTDYNVYKKISDLYDSYMDVKKKKSRKSEGAVNQRNSFEASLDSLFDVTKEDAEKLIRADSSRSKQRKEEDLSFLRDQRTTRNQGMSVVDHKHVKIMMNREEREERVEAQVRKERERIESEKGSGNVDMSTDSGGADKSTQTTDTDKSMESLLEQIGHPTSRKRRRTRSGEVRTITLEVPENILEKTQQIATAKGISPQAHVDIIAAVISASGGNIDDFRLSRTTGYRSREKVEKVVAANAKSEFRKICQDRSRKLIVHFDGKLTEELAPMKIHKEKKDRVAMLVRSPDLEEGEQLLGAPELKSGSGMK